MSRHCFSLATSPVIRETLASLTNEFPSRILICIDPSGLRGKGCVSIGGGPGIDSDVVAGLISILVRMSEVLILDPICDMESSGSISSSLVSSGDS